MQEKSEVQAEKLSLLSIEPITVIRDILKRWYWIVAVALLAGMAAYVVSGVFYTPVYKTTTTYVVSAKGSNTTVYQNLSATTNLATVFSEVLNSSILREAILEKLDMTSFDGTIKASAIEATNLLTLEVTSSNPRTAFLVTRAIIENHQVVSYQVLGDTILEVLQEPKVPVSPINFAGEVSNMEKAAVLAAAAVCVILATLSVAKDTVRTKEEAEKKLDCRVLGVVGHERKYKTLRAKLKRKKTSILITDPTVSFLFAETLHKLRRQVEQHMPAGGKVLMVTSVKENEGKSTLAVNLALAMARKDKKVLLIDADLRKPSCYKILEYFWRGPGTVEVATERVALQDALLEMKNTGLHMLLARKGVRTSTDISGSEGMARLIAQAREQFDFVVVDTLPMSAAPDAECIMELVDATLLTVQQNVVTADILNDVITVLQGAEAKCLGCVLNNMYGVQFHGGGYGYGYGYGYGRYGKYGAYGAYRKYAAGKTQADSAGKDAK